MIITVELELATSSMVFIRLSTTELAPTNL